MQLSRVRSWTKGLPCTKIFLFYYKNSSCVCTSALHQKSNGPKGITDVGLNALQRVFWVSADPQTISINTNPQCFTFPFDETRQTEAGLRFIPVRWLCVWGSAPITNSIPSAIFCLCNSMFRQRISIAILTCRLCFAYRAILPRNCYQIVHRLLLPKHPDWALLLNKGYQYQFRCWQIFF